MMASLATGQPIPHNLDMKASEAAYGVVREGERFRKAILDHGDNGQPEQARQLRTQFCDMVTASFTAPNYLSAEDLETTLKAYRQGKSEDTDWEIDLPGSVRFRQLLIKVVERVVRACDKACQRADELNAIAEMSKQEEQAQQSLQRLLDAAACKLGA